MDKAHRKANKAVLEMQLMNMMIYSYYFVLIPYPFLNVSNQIWFL